MALTDLHGDIVADKLSGSVPDSVEKSDLRNVWIKSEKLIEVCQFMMSEDDFRMDYLNAVTAVDFIDHFDGGLRH